MPVLTVRSMCGGGSELPDQVVSSSGKIRGSRYAGVVTLGINPSAMAVTVRLGFAQRNRRKDRGKESVTASLAALFLCIYGSCHGRTSFYTGCST